MKQILLMSIIPCAVLLLVGCGEAESESEMDAAFRRWEADGRPKPETLLVAIHYDQNCTHDVSHHREFSGNIIVSDSKPYSGRLKLIITETSGDEIPFIVEIDGVVEASMFLLGRRGELAKEDQADMKRNGIRYSASHGRAGQKVTTIREVIIPYAGRISQPNGTAHFKVKVPSAGQNIRNYDQAKVGTYNMQIITYSE